MKDIYQKTLCFLFIFFLAFPFYGQQKTDEESTKLIRKYTTAERFLTPLVDHIPESDKVPSPRDVLGYVVGTANKLTYYADIISYMEALAKSSERVELIHLGKTTLGREMYAVLITSKEAIENIEKYRDYAAALADPRKISEDKAKETIKKAKPIYYISCNIHSAETGSSEMCMELAYRLAVSEDSFIKSIRDNVIVLIVPSVEPDGHDTYTDWYYQHTKNIKDERSKFPRAPFWGKYVYHDNNRDIGVSLPLTRNLIKMLLEWHPQVHTDLHESFAYLYISPGKGPFRECVDPILINEWHWLTFYEITELTKMGLQGVWTHEFGASWYPGYLFEMSNLHNVIGRFYETYGNGGATTMERDVRYSEERGRGRKYLSREWYRPWPADEKVLWSIRNNVNYQQSGVLSSLKNVAENRETILYNFWKKGRNNIQKGQTEPPYAWIVHSQQRNPEEMANLLNLLMTQGVEVHKTEEEFRVNEESFPKGSYLIRMDQPYRTYAKTMLEVQKFPERFPAPFDDTGWTLGYMHGVKTARVYDQSILDIPVTLQREKIKIKGEIRGKATLSAYIIPHKSNSKLATARFSLKDMDCYAAEEAFQVNGQDFLPGSIIIPVAANRESQYDQLSSVVKELGLKAYAVDEEVEIKKHPLNLPRIAIYHTWTYTQDSGWVRFAFDHYQIPFTTISKDRVRQGNLNDNFDVIVIPRQRSAKEIVFGHDPELGPVPCQRTDDFKFTGLVDQSKDITGGMGFMGLKNLSEFVDAGGVLVLLGSSSTLAMEYGLVRNIAQARTKELEVPGSIVKSKVAHNKSPIVYGYEQDIPILFHSFGTYGTFGLMFDIPKEEEGHVVVKFTTGDDLCMSGIVKGAEEMKGKAAIVDIPKKKGHIIMFNFNPLHRFQNKVNFMFVFNILLNFDDL
jgi:hypothetical protein